MKDKQIGKTVFKYLCLDGHHQWQHPKGYVFNETQMDEMNAVDVKPPVVLKPFRLEWNKTVGQWKSDYITNPYLDPIAIYQVSARIIDGEAELVAEKVRP